jgi:hypothetical protein
LSLGAGAGAGGGGGHMNCMNCRQYWASVSYLDENIGKMLDELESLGAKTPSF